MYGALIAGLGARRIVRGKIDFREGGVCPRVARILFDGLLQVFPRLCRLFFPPGPASLLKLLAGTLGSSLIGQGG